MELLIKVNQTTYEDGDVICVYEDGHEYGSGELDTNVFRIVKGVNLTNKEYVQATTPDQELRVPSYATSSPQLLAQLSNPSNVVTNNKRRYTYTNNKMESK